MPRFHVDVLVQPGALVLPAGAARHVQVLRLQPGAPITLFDGRGGEWSAEVLRIGRSDVDVRVDAHDAVERELPRRVTLALAMPANDRMDDLVEKATELGVFAIQPLMSERSVLRLAAERAAKKVAHWRGVAIAASEQSGRTRVPQVHEVRTLADWLRSLVPGAEVRRVLSLRESSASLADGEAGDAPLLFLSGPEGGLSEAEEAAARAVGFEAVSLGSRVLRADTAPLAALAHVALRGR